MRQRCNKLFVMLGVLCAACTAQDEQVAIRHRLEKIKVCFDDHESGATTVTIPYNDGPFVGWDDTQFRAVVGDLRNYTKMTRLNLGLTHITDDALADVGTLRQLTYLGLDDTGVTEAGLAHLATLPKLETVSLMGCRKLCEGTLNPLASLRLKRLILRGAQITDDQTECFAELQTLEELDLGFAHVGDTTMRRIARLPHLRVLWLDSTLVSDAGLLSLMELPVLSELMIGSPYPSIQFSADALRRIVRVPTLKRLTIGYLSDEFDVIIDEIRRENPAIDIR